MTEDTHPLNLFNRDFDSEGESSEERGEELRESEERTEIEPERSSSEEERGGLEGSGRVDPEGEEGGEEESEEGEQEESLESSKKILAKYGAESVEIPESATFEVEGREISYKDLANSYLTRQEIDRRFSEVDREKKKLIENQGLLQKKLDEQALIDQNVRLVMGQAKEGNIMGAVQVLLNMAGGNNRDIVKKLVDQSSEIAERLGNMSEDEKEVYFNKNQLDYEREKLKQEREVEETRKRKEQIRGYVQGLKEKHAITDNELGAAFERLQELDKKNQAEGKPLNFYTGVTKEAIANKCAEFVLAGRHYNRIVKIIAKVLPERAEDLRLQNEVARLCEPKRSDADIEDVIRGFAGKRKKSASSESSQDSTKEVSSYGSPKSGIRKQEATPQRTPVERSGAERDEAEGAPILSFQQLIEKADKEDSKAA